LQLLENLFSKFKLEQNGLRIRLDARDFKGSIQHQVKTSAKHVPGKDEDQRNQGKKFERKFNIQIKKEKASSKNCRMKKSPISTK
jgi:hypothetical protein